MEKPLKFASLQDALEQFKTLTTQGYSPIGDNPNAVPDIYKPKDIVSVQVISPAEVTILYGTAANDSKWLIYSVVVRDDKGNEFGAAIDQPEKLIEAVKMNQNQSFKVKIGSYINKRGNTVLNATFTFKGAAVAAPVKV